MKRTSWTPSKCWRVSAGDIADGRRLMVGKYPALRPMLRGMPLVILEARHYNEIVQAMALNAARNTKPKKRKGNQ